VGTGVAKVFALEQDRGIAARAEPRRVVQRRGATGVVGEEVRQVGLEGRVGARLLVGDGMSVSGT
jgi:hypothetical protein